MNQIDKYISKHPKEVQIILEKIRATIMDAAPDSKEIISYQMPAYKYDGKPLVYFAAFKNHIGLYPPIPENLRTEASKYLGPKGNLKFPLSEPIPYDLIAKIVNYRITYDNHR